MVKKLFEEIDEKRKEMIKSGIDRGLSDEKTLKLSQELDKLINQSMQKNNELNKSAI